MFVFFLEVALEDIVLFLFKKKSPLRNFTQSMGTCFSADPCELINFGGAITLETCQGYYLEYEFA